jgi:probable rRNA maturation factor
MISVQATRALKLPFEKSILLNAARVTLELSGISSQSDLSIIVGNDAFIRKFNQRYRGIDTATDVLSFSSGEMDPDTSNLYLGDVLISLPQALQQAVAENHSPEVEVQLLVVHGVLHLLGYDHYQTDDRIRMQAIQDKILKSLALNLDIKL